MHTESPEIGNGSESRYRFIRFLLFAVLAGSMIESRGQIPNNGNLQAQEYGDAVYRQINDAWLNFFGADYNHTAIYAGLNSAHIKKVMEAIGEGSSAGGDTTVEIDLSDINNRSGLTYYGAYTTVAANLPFAGRKSIVATATAIAGAYIPYVALDAINYYSGGNSVGYIREIRCDAVVEYAYEANGYPVWWPTANSGRWSILNYPGDHNDSPTPPTDPSYEFSPWAQRGAPGGSFWGPSPGNTYMRRASVIGFPTYQVTQVTGPGFVDVTIQATDESGIHLIGYSKPGDTNVYFSPTQPQHPTSATYSYGPVRILNSGTLKVIAMDNGGNFPTAPVEYAITVPPASISVTVQSSSSGRSFSVDGTTYSSAQTFTWTPGASHTIATTSPQSGGAGIQYVLNSWSDGGAMSHTVAPTSSRTYTANFTPQYYLTMSAGAGGTVSPSGGWKYGVQVVPISATPNSGFRFGSWTGSGSGSYSGNSRSAAVTMNEPITEAASFVRTYSVSTGVSPGGTGLARGGGTFDSGATVTVTASPNACYRFVNWTENGAPVSAAPSYQFTANANRNLVANFALTVLTISTCSSPAGGGTTRGGGTVNCGASVTVTATANTGYRFVNWTEGGGEVSRSASYSFSASGDRTLVANFARVYEVATSVSPAGGGTTSGGGTFDSGASVTVVATTNAGYRFLNWTEGGAEVSRSASYTWSVSADRTLVANFVRVFTIATSASPTVGGTTSGGGTFDSGASVTVVATTNAGYRFANWTEGGGEVSRSANYTFTASANRTLVANFIRVYRITTSASPLAGGSTSGGVFDSGASATVVATPSTGYRFVNWTEGSNEVSRSASYTFSVTAKRKLVAHFLDVQPPSVVVVTPPANARVKDASVTVTGQATDNDAVASVWWQSIGGTWLSAVGTAEWNAPIGLLPGTNVFRVYAQDLTGNRSATNEHVIFRIVRARLPVQMMGQGILTPNYSNVLLEIGRNYSMSAMGSNGHKFKQWELSRNWLNPVVSTNATLNFTMQSNLTVAVTFVDKKRPTVVVTNLVEGQRVHDAVYDVKGSASDNVGVSQVWYRLNGGDWALADGTSNWLAALVLNQRTNEFEVYATDAMGIASATNRLSFLYVPVGELLVEAVGRGSLTPNYSNAVLEIGERYSLTATGLRGHTFKQWEQSTNWLNPVVSTNATLDFTMQSNLTLTVVFADTKRPKLTVTNLAAGQRISNAVFAVQGSASDNVGVSSVWFRLNAASWAEASGTNAWVAPLAMVRGTNTFQAYATDAAGNSSVTAIVSFVYVECDTLRLAAVGVGMVAPNYSNAVLEVGLDYSMTGVGTNGHTFKRWETSTNGVNPMVSTNARLSFMMRPNLTVTVVFADTKRPGAMVTNLATGQRISNAVFTARGFAIDNVGVSNVWCRVNGATWTKAMGTTAWTNPIVIASGTNVFEVFAVDAAGNYSLTNRKSFVGVLPEMGSANRLRIGLTRPGREAGNLVLVVEGGATRNARVEFSRDLLKWETLCVVTNSPGLIELPVLECLEHPAGFYRVVAEP